jgi:hypothetical protein
MGMGKPVDEHLRMAGSSVHIRQQVYNLTEGIHSVLSGFIGFGILEVVGCAIQALLFGNTDSRQAGEYSLYNIAAFAP